MRALIFKQQGTVETVEIADLPLQAPEKGQVRIKLTSIGLNRADTLFPEGRYFFKPQFSPSFFLQHKHHCYWMRFFSFRRCELPYMNPT